MTTATHAQPQAVSRPRSAAAARAAGRLAYLDTVRVILISLVIALHTAITYGASGDWTYEDPAQTEMAGMLLTLVTGSVQAFSLGLYFLLSGYFTPGSYDRKGAGQFWKDRLLRLGLPLLVYTFALSRIPTYLAQVARGELTGSFWSYFARTWLTGADEGPTWFIFALLVFLAGYSLWRLAARRVPAERLAWISRLGVPGKRQILGLGLLVAVLMFVVGLAYRVGDTIEVFGIFNLMVIFFVQYTLFFAAGILAYRNDWLARLDGHDLRFWAWLALGLLVLLPVLFLLGSSDGGAERFMGGPYWQAAAFMLWVGLFGVSISAALMLWLRDRKSPRSRLMAFAGPNSYAVYLIHPLVLVPLAVAFTPVLLPPLLKFAMMVPVVVAVCFLVSALLRKIPGVSRVL